MVKFNKETEPVDILTTTRRRIDTQEEFGQNVMSFSGSIKRQKTG